MKAAFYELLYSDLAKLVIMVLGADETFVHVHKDNIAAQKLYDRTGFQVCHPNIHI